MAKGEQASAQLEAEVEGRSEGAGQEPVIVTCEEFDEDPERYLDAVSSTRDLIVTKDGKIIMVIGAGGLRDDEMQEMAGDW